MDRQISFFKIILPISSWVGFVATWTEVAEVPRKSPASRTEPYT